VAVNTRKMNKNSPDSRKEPVPGLSAASSCIRLSLIASSSQSFRPVYTHQCFEGECIAGWRPLLEAEHQSRQIYRSRKIDGGVDDINDVPNGRDIHESYLHCPCGKSNASRIDAHILLPPSCDECRIEIQTDVQHGDTEPFPKKAKAVSFQVVEPDTQHNKMDIKDIVQKISLAVPPIASVSVNGADRTELVSTDNGTRRSSLGCLPKPLGRVLTTYRRKVGGGSSASSEEEKFVVTLADGSDSEVAEYHKSIQPLARWFIETADDVDLADTSRGDWRVMYLFRHHYSSTSQSPTLGLAGYFTLLHVKSPFRKPHPGIIVRVCQALILPPYHRAGHGSKMLKRIHDYADNPIEDASYLGMEIVEINVEDPAPAFVALRDAVDYHRFASLEKDRMNHFLEHDVTKKDFFEIPEENVLSVAEWMRVTKRQALLIHQMWKLQKIMSWKQSVSSVKEAINNDELIKEVETKYRLMVKKSLRSFRQEELGACQSGKEGQRVLLGQWFDETLCHYKRVLKTATPNDSQIA
jgi:histone acetyltransferase 1